MHIIGGDLFDRLPNMEELELYFTFIRRVQIPTIIFDGNHEATKKTKLSLHSSNKSQETLIH
jgi:DNA repair exonuclease